MKEFVFKTPVERVPLTFDFTEQLAEGESISATPTITVRAMQGLDLTPSSRLSGPPVIEDSTVVHQLFDAGTLGEVYEVRCRVTTSNSQVLELAALQPIKDVADT